MSKKETWYKFKFDPPKDITAYEFAKFWQAFNDQYGTSMIWCVGAERRDSMMKHRCLSYEGKEK